VRLISEILRIQDELVAKADPKNGFQPPYPTFNIGMLKGGTAGNIIPNHCEFLLELRVLPGQTTDPIIDRDSTFVTFTDVSLAAGTYILSASILTDIDGVGASNGYYNVSISVPGPGVLAAFAMAGLAGTRRRR